MKIYYLLFILIGIAGAQACKEPAGRTAEAKLPEEKTENRSREMRQTTDTLERFDKDRPYPYAIGIIEYKYTGSRTGRQTIYFKDYGRTQRIENSYENTRAMNSQKVEEIYISTPQMTYYIDMVNKTGYKRSVKDKNYEENLLADITRIGIDSTMRKNGYKKSGVKMVADMKCQVYTGSASEFCFNQGMNIRTNMKFGEGDAYTLEAINIRKDADISDSLFLPPAGMKLPEYKVYEKSQTRDKL